MQIVARAKRIQDIETKYLPKLPKKHSNAEMTIFIAFSSGDLFDRIITKAVRVQSKIVSINTSKIPRQACLCGLLAFDDACAQGEVPQPASFDNIPLETPYLMALEKPKPKNP